MSLKAMNVIYTFVLVLTIVMGIQAVGVILMAALLIIPAVSARYWTDSFFWMIFLSAVFGGGAERSARSSVRSVRAGQQVHLSWSSLRCSLSFHSCLACAKDG